MPGLRADQKAETRSRILEHARRMMLAGGPEAVTIAPLMSELGLTHGGFYAHFGSREDLLDEVMKQICDHTLERFAASEDKDFPRRSVEGYLERYLSPMHRDAVDWGCPLAYLSGDLPKMSRVSRRMYASAHKILKEGLAVRLRLSGARDAEDLASSLLSELAGTLSIAKALGRGKQSTALLASATAKMKERVALATHSHV